MKILPKTKMPQIGFQFYSNQFAYIIIGEDEFDWYLRAKPITDMEFDSMSYITKSELKNQLEIGDWLIYKLQ